jgi:hypothetical protein
MSENRFILAKDFLLWDFILSSAYTGFCFNQVRLSSLYFNFIVAVNFIDGETKVSVENYRPA